MDDIVEVEFEEDGEVEKYKLVTSIRGNSMENRVSIESPIGKALKGHRVGDRVLVNVNENVNSLPILVNSGLSIELLLITVAIDKLLELPSLKI